MEGPEGSPYQVCFIQYLASTTSPRIPRIPGPLAGEGVMQRQRAHPSIPHTDRCPNTHYHNYRAGNSSSTSLYPPSTPSSRQRSRSERKSTTQMSQMMKRGACAWGCYGQTSGSLAPRSRLFCNLHANCFRSRCPMMPLKDGLPSNTRTTGSAMTRSRGTGLGNGLFPSSPVDCWRTEQLFEL